MGEIVEAHDEIRHLVDLIHYDTHQQRVETAEFRKNKEKLHQLIKDGKIPPCYINNGRCEGQTEIHHFFVEYSAGSEVDWKKVQQDVNIDNPDDFDNLIPLCHKHHMGIGTGIHMVSYPAWELQKYLNEENLDIFEKAVAHLKEKYPNHSDPTHNDHVLVNAKASDILHYLASKRSSENVQQTIC